ncbi:hypothetical protein LQW54_011684 [Pestalotiopsis sp. IQ-011]
MATSTFNQTILGLPEPLSKGTISLDVDVDEDAAPMTYGVAATTPAATDDGSIIYVNVFPDTLATSSLLAQAQADVEASSSFWSLKATEAVDAQANQGKFPNTDKDHEIKKSNYKIRVMEYGIAHSGWMSLKSSQNAHRQWTLETKDLHDQILKTILSGLDIPEKSLPEFEKVLQSIAEGVKKSTSHSAEQTRWILITVYRYDSVQKKVFSTMRTIYFSINQKQVEFTKSKNEKGVKNPFELMFKQDDYALNSSLWNNVRSAVQTWIDSKNANVIFNPFNVPVPPQ